ncbi:replication protein A 70 kDa DNA-binding subunit B [Tanacetum coccineum]
MNSNNATRSVLKSHLKRNNGKNVSIFENSPQAENSEGLPLLPNRWKISFYKGTEVTRIDQIDDNFIGFVNEPFSRILDSNNEYHDHDCVDVIGTIVSIGNIVPMNGYGCSKVRRTIVIEDTQSLRLECTFWDKWALMWNEYAEKLDEVGHLDFVLMLGKSNIGIVSYKPAIHNALFGTRIYINKDITPLQSFRKSYEANSGYNANEFKIGIHNPDIHVVAPAEFMQGCLRKMVGMIRDIEPETYCVVYATIHSIQYENGWAYTACKACNTKVTPIQSKVGSSSRNKKQLWYCKNHGETYSVVSRFKIIVRIFDESGSAQVVLFDNNVYKMTKLSAWQIMEEQGMDTNQYFPDDLNHIIGKQYLFKIKYSQFNHDNNSHVYRAEKVTQDVETINYFQNGFVKYEDEEGNNTSQQNDENYVDDHTVQNEKDDHTSPSVEINEQLNQGKNNIVNIDLSDYETEDEEEDFNTTKKLVTVKLEKNP